MLLAYLNYPNAAITVHGNPRCGHVRARGKEGQRTVKITVDSLSEALGRFAAKEYRFAATPESNDMWVEIDCADRDFELAVVKFLQKTVGKQYRRIGTAPLHVCKCAEPSA